MIKIDIDKILTEMALGMGKEKTYKPTLKRTYNKIKKEKTEEGLDEILADAPDQFERFILLGVCKKHNFDKDKLEEIIICESLEHETGFPEELDEDEEVGFDLNKKKSITDEYIYALQIETGMLPEEIMKLVDEKKTELKGLISTEGALFIISKELGVETNDGFKTTDDIDDGKEMFAGKGWKDVFKTIKKKEFEGESQFKKVPNLQLLLNIGMKLKLTDPSDEPYIHNGLGRDGKPYTSYAMNVDLVEILTEDDEILENVYEKGDFRGQDLYTKKREYKLWLNEMGFESFVAFWRDTLGLDQPDGRTFILKKAQKRSKSTGRNYNVFKFYIPRK